MGTAGLAAAGIRRVTAQTPESTWSEVPSGTTFQPITQGTADDLILLSGLITIARITALPEQPGVLKYYNDHVGLAGPRILCGEEGTVQTGTLSVSPGSTVGAAQLIRLPKDGEEAHPVVLVPQSRTDLHPGELAYFPADTAFRIDNFDGTTTGVVLEIDVFPRFAPDDGIVVEGMTSVPLAVDIGIETSVPLAPKSLTVGRLILDPKTKLSTPRAQRGPQLYYIEQGSLTVSGRDGELQLCRSDTNYPGETVEAKTALDLTVGDAFLIPPGGLSRLHADNGATLLTIEIMASS